MDSAATATNSAIKKQSGFKGKRHDLATKERISQTQRKRYALLNQMVRQHQNNEESQRFGPIDLDSPTLKQKIKDIVRELLQEEIKRATPIRQNIPLF